MSLVAYADSDEDNSDNESSDGVSLPLAAPVHTDSAKDRVEPVQLAGPAILGQN